MEKYHEKNRSTYYEILHSLQGNLFYNISPTLDLTPWIEYWISSLVHTAEESVLILENRASATAIDSESLELEGFELALSLFNRHLKLSAKQLQDLMGLERTQTVAKINFLISKNLIKKIGGGRSTLYLLVKDK